MTSLPKRIRQLQGEIADAEKAIAKGKRVKRHQGIILNANRLLAALHLVQSLPTLEEQRVRNEKEMANRRQGV